MKTSQSVDWSLGVDSFISPYKNNKGELSVQTMETFQSAQYSQKNLTLPFNTPFRQQNQKQSSLFSMQKIPEIQPDINQIKMFQRWILMYYSDYQLGQERILLNNKLIKQQKKLNEHKIKSIHSLKKQIQQKREDCQRIKRKASVREKKTLLTIKEEIKGRRDNIERIINQFDRIESKTSSRYKKMGFKKTNPPPTPIYIIGTPPVNFSYINNYPNRYSESHKNSSHKFNHFSHQQSFQTNINPQIKIHKVSKKSSLRKPAQYSHRRQKTTGSHILRDKEQFPKLNQSRNRELRKSNKMSGKWENDGEQKDVIEELSKSQKNKLGIRKTRLDFPEQSNFNITIEQSEVGSIDKQNRLAPIKIQDVNQSAIKIDMPEDDSRSKSQDISAEQTKSKSKQRKNSGEQSIRNSSKKYPPLHNKSRVSGDILIKDILLGQQNLAKSDYLYDPFSFKDLDHDHDQEQDNDDITSIQLLTVSKISKQKQFSQKFINQKDNEDMGYRSMELEQSTGSKIMKNKSNINFSKKRHMASIQEEEFDEEHIRQKEKKDRSRKMSGTRFSAFGNYNQDNNQE